MSDRLDDDYEVRRYTRDEALRVAQDEAKRALEVTAHRIAYVCYSSEVHDYCLCEFEMTGEAWVRTVRCLTPEERLPGEEIQDATIRELAQAGNTIAAVRLYRAKHGVGLKEALGAIKSKYA